jgi:hypothetical protein
MDTHVIRAAVAELDAHLDALQTEMQRAHDTKCGLLRLLTQGEGPLGEPSAMMPATERVPADHVVGHNLNYRICRELAANAIPLSAGSLADACGITKKQLRYTIGRLVRAGRVQATGVTNSRRYSLPVTKGSGRAAAQPPAADSEEDARPRRGESLPDARRRLDHDARARGGGR